jgi:hypothetical protein
VVIRNDLPFAIVESADVRLMLKRLRSDIVVPSADTLKREIMNRHREESACVGDRLRNASGKISLTLDCWTSPNTKAFMGITAHYIDANWALQSLILDFVPLPGLHTGEELCEALVATCDRLGILPKLQGITTDNAANIDKLLVRFESACYDRGVMFDKKEQHVRCIAHVTNLAVQALLRKLGTEAWDAESILDDDNDGDDDGSATQTGRLPCIAKLRRLVVKIRSTPQRRNEFKGQCDAHHMPRKEPILDTRTRWNSTYAMITASSETRCPLWPSSSPTSLS